MPWEPEHGICALSLMADLYPLFHDWTLKVSKLEETQP